MNEWATENEKWIHDSSDTSRILCSFLKKSIFFVIVPAVGFSLKIIQVILIWSNSCLKNTLVIGAG